MKKSALLGIGVCAAGLLCGLAGIIIKQKRTIDRLQAESVGERRKRTATKIGQALEEAATSLLSEIELEKLSIPDTELKEYFEETVSDCFEDALKETIRASFCDKKSLETLSESLTEELTKSEWQLDVKSKVEKVLEKTFEYDFWLRDPVEDAVIRKLNEGAIDCIADCIVTVLKSNTLGSDFKKDVFWNIRYGIAEAIVKEVQPSIIASLQERSTINAVCDLLKQKSEEQEENKTGEEIVIEQSDLYETYADSTASSQKSTLEQVEIARSQTSCKWGEWSPENAKQWLKRKIRRYAKGCQFLNKTYTYQNDLGENVGSTFKDIAIEYDCPVPLVVKLAEEMKDAYKEFEKNSIDFSGITKTKCTQEQKEEIISAICHYSIDGNGFMLSEEITEKMNLSNPLYNSLKSIANERMGLGFRNRDWYR